MARRRVLVTGASGFLGRRVVQSLRAHGFTAVPVSRQRSDDPESIQVDHYSELHPGKGEDLIHLAETASIGTVNAGGPDLVSTGGQTLEILIEKLSGHLVYASSVAVFGDCSPTPHKPGDPAENQSLYAKAKLANEHLTLAAGGTVLRLSNLVGPGMHKDSVVGDILAGLRKPGPITLRDLTPVRDFLSVKDAAKAFTQAVKCRKTGTFNVGSGHSITIEELARKTLRLAGEADRPVVAENKSACASVLRLDISETQSALGWIPEEGLENALDAYLLENGLEHE